MKRYLILLSLLVCSILVYGQPANYEIVWSDEFDGNGAINSEKWHHQTQLPNGGSWYNGEIQHYTDRIENSFVSNGTLKVVAKKETYTDQGFTKTHTSARLNSKVAFTYGYVAVRAKLPQGVGTWPAIWTLGQNITEPGGYWYDTNGTVGWPNCGEIDIMEHWGSNQNFVQSATHTPSSFGNTVNLGGQNIPTASSQFHVYSLEWTPERMIFSVDDTVHYVYEPPVQNSSTWPFDANQYLLLNVAILPEISPSFSESSMEIDYVRVYQEESLSLSVNQQRGKMQLFPNPVRDSLTIDVPSYLIGAKALLYSATGKQLFGSVIETNRLVIDVSKYAQGIYFFSLTKGSEGITRKIIID